MEYCKTKSRTLKFDLISFRKASAKTKLRRLVRRSESIVWAKGCFFEFAHFRETHGKGLKSRIASTLISFIDQTNFRTVSNFPTDFFFLSSFSSANILFPITHSLCLIFLTFPDACWKKLTRTLCVCPPASPNPQFNWGLNILSVKRALFCTPSPLKETHPFFSFLRILTGKKHRQIKLKRLEKGRKWAFGLFVH